MYSKSHNKEIMIYNKADEAIKELLESLHNRYQIGLETAMRGSDCIFDCVDLLDYKYHEIIFKCGGSYVINVLGWIKNKKETTNPISGDDKCYQYHEIIALNYEEIGKKLQRISKIKLFISKYNWKLNMTVII